MSQPLDSLDLRILKHMQDDATLSLFALAELVGSSKSVCWRRVKRFLDDGIIKERVAILDPKLLGFGVMVIAFIKIDGRSGTPVSEFITGLRKLPQVIECHALMGDVDMMLKILVRDIEEYEHFLWNNLSNVAGIQDIKSCISISRFINTTKIPLEARDKLRDAQGKTSPRDPRRPKTRASRPKAK